MPQSLSNLIMHLKPYWLTDAAAVVPLVIGEGPGIDIIGSTIGLGGDTILLYKSNGDPIAEYPATEAGINSAFAAAVAGNIIEFPDNIVIAVTAGKTMPAGVSVTGPNLSFSGFAGVAITMTTGSDLSNFNIAYNGAGQANAKGVYANAVQCNVSNGRALVYDATTNVGLDLKGNNTGGLRINAQNLTGECYGGTTNHGITIRDHVAARDIYAEVHDGASVGIRTEISSLEVDDWIVGGWGNAPSGGAAYGVQVASGAARLIGVNCSGNTSGIRIESGATAYTYGCRATGISNAGTILGETFVDSATLYIDDEANFYGETGSSVVLRSIDNNTNTKLLITPKGVANIGDTALHLYHSRTSEGAADELFFGMGAAHGTPVYLFGTGDATNHGNMLDILFFTENGVNRTDVMRLDAAGWMTFLKHFDVEEIASPANPPANTARVYSRDDSGTTKLYYKRSDGTEIELGGGSGGDVVGPAGATDGAWALFDGVTGKLLKDGGLPILNNLSDVDTSGVGTGDIIYKSAGDWVDYPLGIGSNITNDGSSINIGDIAGGNYLSVDLSSGEIGLNGNATVFEDLRVEPTVRQAAGAGIPAFEKYFDDAPGTSRGVYLYSFTDEAVAGNEKEVFFTMQMPHTWKIGSDIHMHVHFVPAATVNSSEIIWGLEYTWKSIGEVFGDTVIIQSSTTLLPDDANITAGKHYLAEFADISPGPTASSLSSILIGRLFRNSSDAGDTYTNKVGLLYIDAHYEVDSLGSTEEYSKTVFIADSDGETLLDSDGIELTE